MAITENAFDVGGTRVQLATGCLIFRAPVLIFEPKTVEILHPAFGFSGQTFVFRRVLGVFRDAIEIPHSLRLASPALTFRRILIPTAPTVLIDIMVAERIPGDTGVEIVFRIPVHVRQRSTPVYPVGDIDVDWDLSGAGLFMEHADIKRDPGLETAMIISLLSDRRATPEEVEDARMHARDLRGWWADTFQRSPVGSHLWLLSRAKLLPATLDELREHALECWRWMLADGIADWIQVEVSRNADDTVAIEAVVARPGGNVANFRFHYNWEAQSVRLDK